MENVPPDRAIRPEPPEPNITWVLQPRIFRMFTINEQKLIMLSTSFTSINLFFLGLASGAAIAVLITLLTTTFASPFIFAAFIAAFLVSAVFSFYFAFLARRDHARANELVRQIRERS